MTKKKRKSDVVSQYIEMYTCNFNIAYIELYSCYFNIACYTPRLTLGEKSTGSIPLQSNATIVANFPTSLSQYGLIESLNISVSIWIIKYVHTYTYMLLLNS